MYYVSEKKNRASPLPVVQTHGCTLIDSSSCSSERRNFQPTWCMHHEETIAFILLQTCVYIYIYIIYIFYIYILYIYRGSCILDAIVRTFLETIVPLTMIYSITNTREKIFVRARGEHYCPPIGERVINHILYLESICLQNHNLIWSFFFLFVIYQFN